MKNTLRLFLVLLLAAPLPATIASATVWEVRPTNGANTNGGGFVTGASGTDMSQFNAKNAAACSGCQSATVNISTTDGVTAGTTTITSATGNYSSALIGNIVHISGGTGSVSSNWYQVLTVPGATSFTVDRSTGLTAGTGVTIDIGGALQTLGQLNTVWSLNASANAWMKAEATVTTASQITINFGGSSTLAPSLSGYTTTRGDGGQVTVQATAGIGGAIINITSASSLLFANFKLDCNSTNSRGLNIQGSAGATAYNIYVFGACTSAGGGISFNNAGVTCRLCIVNGMATVVGFQMDGGNGGNFCIYCAAINGTGVTGAAGFAGGYTTCTVCVSANNAGTSADGFQSSQNTGTPGWVLINSISRGNGRDGLRITALSSNVTVNNSVFYGNTGWGINETAGTAPIAWLLNYNAFGSNSLGARSGVTAGANDVTLTADPFTSSSVFTLNTTAGGGALLQQAGFPGAFTTGGVTVGTGKLDIGALQYAAAAGAGSSSTPILQ